MEAHAFNALGTSDWYAFRRDVGLGALTSVGFALIYHTRERLIENHPELKIFRFVGPPVLWVPHSIWPWSVEQIPRAAVAFMLAYYYVEDLRKDGHTGKFLTLDFPRVQRDRTPEAEGEPLLEWLMNGPAPEQS
jgi:hypothetical protein